MKREFLRQRKIITPDDLKKPITVIGAGGIGSPTVLALAMMGCPKIKLYDHDSVQGHNLPSQIYRICDVGRPKVLALAEIVFDHTGVKIEGIQDKYENQELSGIVISAVDKMEIREEIWGNVNGNTAIDFYIDARMGGEDALIFPVYPWDEDRVDFYEDKLYPDEEAVEDPCSQSIVYNTFGIASFIGNLVKQHAKSETDRIPKMIAFQFYSWVLTPVM